MKIERIELSNFQSYESANLDFEDGTTLIHGDNGAGKSTLLRAIFGGLYQTDATTETSAGYNLADLVTREEDEGSVSLTFSIGDEEYTIEWVIEVEEDDEGERQGSTKSCTMTGTTFSNSVEGVRDVRDKVEELVGMGATEFANSVYVQQKRFSRLINANESERKEILDGLLGLNKLDEYVERMKIARRPAKRRKDDAQSRLSEVRERIGDYDEDALKQERKQLKDEIQEEEDKLERISDLISDVQRAVDRHKDSISEYESLKERKEKIEDNISDKRESIETIESEITEMENRIDELKQKIENSEEDIQNKKIDEYEVNSKQTAQEVVENLEEERDELYSEEQNLKADLESKKTEMSHLKDDLDELNAEITSLEEDIDSLTNKVSDIIGEDTKPLERLSEQISNSVDEDTLTDEIECTESELQEIKDDLSSKEAEKRQIESRVRALSSDISSETKEYENLIETVNLDTDNPYDNYESALSNAEAIADELSVDISRSDVFASIRDNVSEAHSTTLDKYHRIATGEEDGSLESNRETLEKLDSLKTELARALRYEKIAEKYEDINELEEEIDEQQSQISSISEDIDNLKDKKSEVQTRIEYLSNLSDAQEVKQEIEDKKDKISELEEDKEQVNSDIASLQESIESLDEDHSSVKDEREIIELKRDRVKKIVSLYDSIQDWEQRISSLRESISDKNDRKNDLKSDIQSYKSDLEDIKEKLRGNDIDDLREEKNKKESSLEDARANKKNIKDRLQNKRDKLSDINAELDNLKSEYEREEELEQEEREADDIVKELTQMIEIYESVKLDLRTQTLDLLNKYTNEIFDKMYQNESYEAIRIDQDYNIRLVTSGGELIDPDKCSGGEGVIVNIALRAGVYRVISEQDESGGDSLPPFILDEPTNHLDDSHVGQISNVIDGIQDWNVPQVFVVSHRESLVDSADHELFVEKDPATDRSVANFR